MADPVHESENPDRLPESNSEDMIPVSDILHRTFVLSLAGLSAYGLFLGVAVHRETLEKGRGLMAKREQEALAQKDLEEKEHALAEASAQAIFVQKPL